MAVITLGVADDHALFRKGMIALLSENPDFRVVLEAANGRDLINQLDHKKPEVLLLDLNMPEMDGIQASAYIVKRHPGIRIIAVTMHDSEAYILKLIGLGAKGYLLKNTGYEELCEAVYSVIRNGFYFNDLVSTAMLKKIVLQNTLSPQFNTEIQLTERETEILRLICQEKTTEEIAEMLFISPRTVEGHRKNLMTKVGARNMTGVIVYAVKHGLAD